MELMASNMIPANNTDDDERSAVISPLQRKNKNYEWDIVWKNVFIFIYLHVATAYAFIIQVKGITVLFAASLVLISGIGITAGAHRLWTHKAYKARWPLRLYLAMMQTVAFQNSIYSWVRDHRIHHKFTETDADPHNARRGFFFSHMGWLMMRKLKDVYEKGVTIDMSDLEKDPIVVSKKVCRMYNPVFYFHKNFIRNYWILMPLLCFVMPTCIPVWLWNEDPWASWYVSSVARYTISLHLTCLVNSVAHIWGTKPYDKNIAATDNLLVAIGALGEGWHNYHHAFPWDYKAAELGNYRINISTAFIDIAARFGLAYDLKTVSKELIRNRVLKTGDGSHPWFQRSEDCSDEHHHPENPIWGWDDKDIPEEDKELAVIIHKKI